MTKNENDMTRQKGCNMHIDILVHMARKQLPVVSNNE